MDTAWKKNAVLFLTSQTVSLFGSSLVQYAIMWYITLNTQSGMMMTISIICGFVPSFFLSPFAGVWADRYDRKKLIMLADSAIALSTLVLAILFISGYEALWLLFVVSAIRSLGTGVQMPAVSAFLPQLVPGDKLTKVNATYSSIQSLVMLVSPMLSGALLTMASIESIFFIDVVTAAIAVSILLLFLKIPVHAKALEQQSVSYFGDFKEGLSYIRKHDYVRTFFMYIAVFMLLAAPVAFLTPLQVTRSFGNDVWRLTAVEMTFSIGMMAGGILMASWGGFKNKVHTMILATLGIGLGTFALGVIPNFWMYLAVMSLIGVTMPVFNTPSTVLLQQKVEENYLGRVFGVFGMISSSMMPLGMLIFGPVADVIAIEWLLIGTGVLLFVQGIFMSGSRVLIQAGKPEPELEAEQV
ncbi:MFS transporter, DHA3 family, macrolide efflux protein [Paenibacillus sp. UNCCL117]|uniref:MFS transporter n=1 Tax=unclassified Paenibacillus TaxID=185978 RepID=UPI00088865BA|nr:MULTISPECIES: MFS transporter [unclassified Paenibacillus]SDC44164.1 MFS transporter, DHA3 family, macrolide efflux protein [Paenibacillus sp. cl123]SFW12800.1 MFS transporter, DHA3 family, macrolide efflux protein [Paenibacillus sp. UNCCL117]